MAADYDKPPVKAGYSRYFTRLDQKPSRWESDAEMVSVPLRFTAESPGKRRWIRLTAITAALRIRTPEDARDARFGLHIYRIAAGTSWK